MDTNDYKKPLVTATDYSAMAFLFLFIGGLAIIGLGNSDAVASQAILGVLLCAAGAGAIYGAIRARKKGRRAPASRSAARE